MAERAVVRGSVVGSVVGILANPASGRDIRRLVAKASVFPTAEKANMVQRVLSALGVTGVETAFLSTDIGGISSAVHRAWQRRRPGRDGVWPRVEFCDGHEITSTISDTVHAVRRMVDAGAKAIVCLGGDGTSRAVAGCCGDVPLLPLSTGTNNAFPVMREATVAGLAAGLVATGAVPVEEATRRATVLEAAAADRTEIALVDVCVSTSRHVASRAVWDPGTVTELYCTFAEPDGIGLSSVPGLLCPSPRSTPDGVALRLGPPAESRYVVHAPIAPGLVLPVGVRDWRRIDPGDVLPLGDGAGAGVVAVDGEREIELRGDAAGAAAATVRLRADGPRVVDVPGTLAAAARDGLLTDVRETRDTTTASQGAPA